jgi:hypothetical protein
MNKVHRSCFAVLLILLAFGPAQGDEIYLSDGRVIDGEVISSADAETVDVRVSSGNLIAVQHFPKTKIQRIVYGMSQRQRFINEINQQSAVLAKRSDATASEWWNLARRLQEHGENASAKELAAHVVQIDRQHPEARKLLGMTLSHGVWMRTNEAATARGEVFSRGSWMTWAAQEQALADEIRRREEQAVARKEHDEQRRLARLSAAVAAENAANASASLYPETYSSGYYRSSYYNSAYGNLYGSSFGGIYTGGYRPIYPVYPGYPAGRPPYCGTGGGWHIGASGGGSNSAWVFRWNGG